MEKRVGRELARDELRIIGDLGQTMLREQLRHKTPGPADGARCGVDRQDHLNRVVRRLGPTW